ncbi:MAG: SPOR domain-containing protein [Chromatiaceae bacterium]|nr:SPOR domain-containing protein [Chromatiaceae bacterium]MCP5408575.1 SPOR domain-containing protein [Chromatiaceae bacterium]MCP5442539.1 SPOR domain-containing protein [Chromatiaceae bacterium]
MSRDYKSRANTQQKRRGPFPGWAWFILGILVGLFFSGLAWLKLLPAEVKSSTGAVTRSAPKAEPPPPHEEHNPKPRFDFFTILPEMEVVVPEPEVVPRGAARQKSAEETVAEADKYMLQMGSFRQYADADRLKASLALVGIQAEIQKVKIDNGEIFHRVRAGPYSPDKVKLLSAKLKENRINSLMIKLK